MTRELNLIYVFWATDPVIGNGPANIKKIVLSSDFCKLVIALFEVI